MAKRILLLFILLSTTIGCSVPAFSIPMAAAAPPSAPILKLVTTDPNATQTPTPFQPVTSTPQFTLTALPTATSTITPTARATATKSGPGPIAPTNVPVLGKYPDGQVRILVLGSDARPTGGFRTDIIMLVTINPQQGTATVLSLPRDLWVDLPGWGANRINTAMVYGGFSLMASTMESNLGVRPTNYIMTTFNGFTQIIDSLGGVDVTASKTLTDKCSFTASGYCTVRPGVTHMNGQYALWYVRSRYSTNDFDRERRSQEVLQALFSKLMNLNAIARIPELYDIYRKNVETNLSLADVVGLAPVASSLIKDTSKLRRYTVGPGQVSDWVVPGSGAMVLVPNYALIRPIIMDAVFTP
jgi:LCP family protein required for cell wall assembly